jgi:light-regulated signal transduction histidine kinase (bacteriophytochrome)
MEFCLRKFDGSYRWFIVKGAAMKNNEGEIVRWFGSCIDIQDQKEKTKELIETNNQLKKINADLDNFVYTASHDLKAPVSNLEGLVKLLMKESNGNLNPKAKTVLGMLDTSVNKLHDTIRDLSEITQLENVDQYSEEICFPDLLDEIKINIQTMILSTKTIFHTNFEIDCIQYNKNNLRSIFYNLISNAIKYRSPERSPEIWIESHQLEDYTLLKVKDNGLGFDTNKKDKLFAMFKRLHSHVEGSGIGLFIVKRLVENAGGKIEVDSEINKGTEFRIYFRNRLST